MIFEFTKKKLGIDISVGRIIIAKGKKKQKEDLFLLLKIFHVQYSYILVNLNCLDEVISRFKSIDDVKELLSTRYESYTVADINKLGITRYDMEKGEE